MKTLENLWDSKEIKPVSPKENQPWIVRGRTDVESEAPILWPPDTKSLLIGKDPYARKDLGQEKKGAIGQEMILWHHWLIDMILSKLWETVKYREAWHAAVHEVTKSQTWLSNWTITKSLLCPWNFPGKTTGVGSHSLFQGVFPTQGLNPGLLHCSRFFTLWATREAPITSI